MLVDPRPEWAADGRRLAARVARAAGGARVDHIGSTAIPGMPAKDVIDLQLTVPTLAAADDLAPALAAAGFPRVPGFQGDMPHPADDDPARWAKRLHANADPGQSVNLHLRVRDAPNWRWALTVPRLVDRRRDGAARIRGAEAVAGRRVRRRRFADRYAEAKEPWLVAAHPG